MKQFWVTYTLSIACTLCGFQMLENNMRLPASNTFENSEVVNNSGTTSATEKDKDKKDKPVVYAPFRLTPAAEAYIQQGDNLFVSSVNTEKQLKANHETVLQALQKRREERLKLRSVNDPSVHYPTNAHDADIMELLTLDSRYHMARAHNADMANMQQMMIVFMLMQNNSSPELQRQAIFRWMQMNSLSSTVGSNSLMTSPQLPGGQQTAFALPQNPHDAGVPASFTNTFSTGDFRSVPPAYGERNLGPQPLNHDAQK